MDARRRMRAVPHELAEPTIATQSETRDLAVLKETPAPPRSNPDGAGPALRLLDQPAPITAVTPEPKDWRIESVGKEGVKVVNRKGAQSIVEVGAALPNHAVILGLDPNSGSAETTAGRISVR